MVGLIGRTYTSPSPAINSGYNPSNANGHSALPSPLAMNGQAPMHVQQSNPSQYQDSGASRAISPPIQISPPNQNVGTFSLDFDVYSMTLTTVGPLETLVSQPGISRGSSFMVSAARSGENAGEIENSTPRRIKVDSVSGTYSVS